MFMKRVSESHPAIIAIDSYNELLECRMNNQQTIIDAAKRLHDAEMQKMADLHEERRELLFARGILRSQPA